MLNEKQDSDAWRMFRIMGEFAGGFETLLAAAKALHADGPRGRAVWGEHVSVEAAVAQVQVEISGDERLRGGLGHGQSVSHRPLCSRRVRAGNPNPTRPTLKTLSGLAVASSEPSGPPKTRAAVASVSRVQAFR